MYVTILTENVNNYNKWIYGNLKEGVRGDVIEFGCGIGNITDYIVHDADTITGIDYVNEFVDYAKDKYKENSKVNISFGDLMDLNEGIRSKKYDTAILLNVLEHIEDDGKALRNIGEVLKDSGKLLLLVPAMQFIYGTLDSAFGHFKRYGKKDMAELLKNNGYKINKMFYMNGVGSFGWFFAGRVMKKKVIPENQAKIFDRLILPVIRPFEKIVKPAFGQSLIVIAEKI